MPRAILLISVPPGKGFNVYFLKKEKMLLTLLSESIGVRKIAVPRITSTAHPVELEASGPVRGKTSKAGTPDP